MGSRQDLIPVGLDPFCEAIEDLIGGQQIQGAMPMAGVVPGYKPGTEGPRFVQRPKAFRIRKTALEGREQAFDKGIVVADMRTAASHTDFQLIKHVHQIRMLHGTAVIGVKGQKRGIRHPMRYRIGQHIPRDKAIFPNIDRPGHQLAAEEIHEGIEKAEPARRCATSSA